MQPQQYKTVARPAINEIVIKKSRFISAAAPTVTVDEAVCFVNQIKTRHHEANHNVSAWIINEGQMRCSDDGEPSGTAGRPVLEVIQRSGLVQTVVVVTRYFGGILLGAGGLVRAYAQAAQEGIAAAGIRLVKLYSEFTVTTNYELSSQVRYFLEQQKVMIVNAEYGEKVTFRACCIPGELEIIRNTIMDISGGKIELIYLNDCYL